MNQTKATPLMQQYYQIRSQYPDVLLLFQVGDFYELFFDDAKKAAAFLGITLTSRGKNNGESIPLCGVPVHALDYYLIKLIRGGFHVALCNQLEEPKPGTVVRRGVTQVFTPGTLTDSKLLDDKTASYLLSFFPGTDAWGLIFGELLTAQLYATIVPIESIRLLEAELVRFFPDEIVLPEINQSKKIIAMFSQLGYCTSSNRYDANLHDPHIWITKQFLDSTPLERYPSLKDALINFYWYLKRNQESSLELFNTLNFYRTNEFLFLDAATQKNLELIKNNQDGGRKNSLYAILDEAITPMGSRTIKKWLCRPLLKKEMILKRQDVVQTFVEQIELTRTLGQVLAKAGDVERIVGRIALARATPYDYILLTQALSVLPSLICALNKYIRLDLIRIILSCLQDFDALYQMLKHAINDDSTLDWIINKGVDQRLDYVRDLVENSTTLLLNLEKREQEKTTINSLKIRYNQIYGYYIEVTKPNLHLVPDYYIRNQTLVGKERFSTIELKKIEREIFTARSEVDRIEQEVFERIKREVAQHNSTLRKLAQALAHLDGLRALAYCAYSNGYVRPSFNDDGRITIVEGKHPVVYKKLGNRFIPNDTDINNQQSLLIITGPNMGGKSTYLRQVALICIMAQCGAFVPAKSASLPILDRIFTRIGAGDNVADGKSTFLIEMEETAVICTQATEKSLVILDEVGRGTSTFDGLAIAQAVVEYIYHQVKARCLFATHYHELTHLEKMLPGIVSFHASSKRTQQGILLLYKIIKGAADGSFGIDVARLAQLPPAVINRADEILHVLTEQEQKEVQRNMAQNSIFNASLQGRQEELLQRVRELEDNLRCNQEVLSRLDAIDLDELSPKKAFDLLWELKLKDG
jgi:DNA mismatch repair protein MutS